MRSRLLQTARSLAAATVLLTWYGSAHAHQVFYVGYAKGVEGEVTVDGVRKNVLLSANYMSCVGKPKEETALAASVKPFPDAGISTKQIKTFTLGRDNVATAEADTAEVSFKVPGLAVYATALSAAAEARCDPASGRITKSGNSTVGFLKINGQTHTITGAPNQTIEVPGGGRVIVNEQEPFGREFRGAALRVIVDNPSAGISGDVYFSRVRARIQECEI